VVCVGTTTVRATESWARALLASRDHLPDEGWHGWTCLFLYPGSSFLVADAMVTNFHVPRSTLLMMVSAFAGTQLVRDAYASAIEARYRFYSLGDACLFR
jgi:S-adenosylmethionine:tRNA ribosyltransferase-isomerase